ncbi:MAG: cobyrinate a,c-diamide synthase [SAR324 cluster bacterium]|nr:cobyrinate a,c-diamide synthase [SAR324 cluster bacterium]
MTDNPLSHGLILSGMQSSSGKTAITCMLMAALQEQGMSLQPFKVGPDFIDPGYHAQYAGKPCINLDAWMMGKTRILQDVQRFGAGKVGIVEGVMGLFDGASPNSDEGSTVELARWLNWPVLLVVPCEKAGRSIAAAIRGFVEEAGAHRICGVILNQIGGESHAHYLKDALAYLNLPVLGAVPKNELLRWPERHLGLHSQTEIDLPEAGELARLGCEVLDIDLIQSLVAEAPEGQSSESQVCSVSIPKRVAIAKDEAFHFYYHANLEYLKNCGVELVEFSPLNETSLPDQIEGVIFGGGFPEIFAAQIADNASMRSSIAQAIANGMPCYAECGGLMILSEELITQAGKRFPMVGVVPGSVQMTPHLNNFGYCFCTPGDSSNVEASWRGHEFHYSLWSAEETKANLWQVTKKYRKIKRTEGFRHQGLHASYVHLYFPTAPEVFEDLFGLEKEQSFPF